MESLTDLGLTRYENALYLTLLQYGRGTAREIAKHSCVPLTATYPNLETLGRKGFVQRIQGEVALFEAIPPAVALVQHVHNQAEALQQKAQKVLPALSAIKEARKAIIPYEPIALTLGTEASNAVTGGFLTTAQKSLHILGWRFRSPRRCHIPAEAFRHLMKRGVDVRIIATGHGVKYREQVLALQKAGIPLRYAPFDNFSVIIKDAQECKITLKYTQPAGRIRPAEKAIARSNIHIKDPDLSSFLDQYYLNLWKKSRPIGEFLQRA